MPSPKRNIYLSMLPLAEARQCLLDRYGRRPIEDTDTIPVDQAVGRVLADPVWARFSAPSFHASAMDGVAVRAQDSFGANAATPRVLHIGQAAEFVNTGHVLPDGFDAVIMIENVQTLDDGRIQIEAPVTPWQHVRKLGEDIVASELLFAQNHRVRPTCIGALLTGGVSHVRVRRKPKVAVIPTGSEIVEAASLTDAPPPAGHVIESNGTVLACMVDACGGHGQRRPVAPDDPDLIRTAVADALSDGADMVLMVGGSSAGSADYTRSVIADMGSVWFHGVAMMPGKPVVAGDIQGTPIFGMPGYPVSAILAFEQLVSLILYAFQGLTAPEPTVSDVIPTRKIPSKLGLEEFLRVNIGLVRNRLVATPLPRGAGSITTFTRADGILRIPSTREGVDPETPVTAELMRPMDEIRRTIVLVGSHDNTLDLLADEIRMTGTGMSLSSSHVGSMGGLMALRQNVCHAAGIHLLDATDGSYNDAYVRQYLPDAHVCLVTLAHRDQGLLVPKGNPKGISGIEDLARPGLMFINRQPGSGTRVLLDYHLTGLGLDPMTIAGYDTTEYTHMSVAAAVACGAADSGLGILAAARALDLDFVPVVTEQYDIAFFHADADTQPIQTLMNIIGTPRFKERAEALGGYHTQHTGTVRHVGPPDIKAPHGP